MLYQFTETIGIFPSPGLRPPSPHAMGRGQGEGFPLIPTEFHCEVVLLAAQVCMTANILKPTPQGQNSGLSGKFGSGILFHGLSRA
jgi:hypothetical protein